MMALSLPVTEVEVTETEAGVKAVLDRLAGLG